jgi:hypothetical protein
MGPLSGFPETQHPAAIKQEARDPNVLYYGRPAPLVSGAQGSRMPHILTVKCAVLVCRKFQAAIAETGTKPLSPTGQDIKEALA